MLLKMTRLAVASFVAALCLSAMAVTAFAAAGAPAVINAAGSPYSNGGISYIAADADVFIAPVDGAAYYYAFHKDSVDAYYAGETGNPVGSWLDGPLEGGAHVATFVSEVSKSSGTPVGASDGWRIGVAMPAAGQPTTLYVVAYVGDEASAVYSHSFYAADEQLVVTDGGTAVFADKGVTVTDSAADVYIANPQPGTEYYYSIDAAGSESVEVYYTGEDGLPAGSYFEGPLVRGAFVATLSSPASMLPVGPDYKISVPAPAFEGAQSVSLSITAVKGGAPAAVYSHRFALEYCLSFELGGAVAARFENNSQAAFDGRVVLAIYDGANSFGSAQPLVLAEERAIAVGPQSSASVEFELDVSLYPPTKYSYAVYCWDGGYAPRTPAVRK